MYQFDPPRSFSALGDAYNPRFPDAEEIIMKLHVNRRNDLAHQLRRVLADSKRETMGLVKSVYEISEKCAICRASDEAQQYPIAGTANVSARNGNLRMGRSAFAMTRLRMTRLRSTQWITDDAIADARDCAADAFGRIADALRTHCALRTHVVAAALRVAHCASSQTHAH